MGSNWDLLERYVQMYNAGDLDGIIGLYAEDAVQAMPDGLYEGREKIRERLALELAAFSDIDWGLTSFVEQGDTFADEWTFAGTHTGPFVLPDGTEIPPTGKRVELVGMELVKVRHERVVVDNLYYDNLGVAVQLGLASEATQSRA
jgi:predicted ester cyclase